MDWSVDGSAVVVDDKQLGAYTYTIGEKGLAFAGPTDGSFSQTLNNIEESENYVATYAYFVANGEGVPFPSDNVCSLKVSLGDDEIETFNPFEDAQGSENFRNRRANILAPASSAELKFELTCETGTPDFTLMVDDIWLVRCDE